MEGLSGPELVREQEVPVAVVQFEHLRKKAELDCMSRLVVLE